MMKICLIFFGILFYAYTLTAQEATRYKWQNDSLIIKWKLDSLGCGGFRSYQIADSIFRAYNLASKSFDSIKIILGMPNVEIDKGDHYILKYYYNSFCECNRLIMGMDMCWIEIQYSKKTRKILGIMPACN